MQTRRKQLREYALSLLDRPLSDIPLRVFSAEDYRELMISRDFRAWESFARSPLGGWIDATGRQADWRALRYFEEFNWGEVPEGPISTGLVAEVFYAVELYAEFESFVSINSIAYDHIMRLESEDITSTKINEAQALAMSSRAKIFAIDILEEINNGIKL